LQNYLENEEYKEYVLQNRLQKILKATKGDPGQLEIVVEEINNAKSLTDVTEIISRY